MTKPINEIMMTLFNNSNGLTLSVLVNANTGGKPVNFSLKGDNTLNFKAINDGLSNMDDNMRAYFQDTKAKFKLLNNKQHCEEMGIRETRFSKGYLQGFKGRKGRTVPAVAALITHNSGDQFVKLNFAGTDYYGELDPHELTDNQRKGGAVAAHRAVPGAGVTEWSDDFMGDNT